MCIGGRGSSLATEVGGVAVEKHLAFLLRRTSTVTFADFYVHFGDIRGHPFLITHYSSHSSCCCKCFKCKCTLVQSETLSRHACMHAVCVFSGLNKLEGRSLGLIELEGNMYT